MLGQSPHLIGGILWIQNPMRGTLEEEEEEEGEEAEEGVSHACCGDKLSTPQGLFHPSPLFSVLLPHAGDDWYVTSGTPAFQP